MLIGLKCVFEVQERCGNMQLQFFALYLVRQDFVYVTYFVSSVRASVAGPYSLYTDEGPAYSKTVSET